MTLVALAIGISLAVTPVVAETEAPESCPDVLANPGYDAGAVIKGCDARISSKGTNPDALAGAYFNRGLAYAAKGDHTAAKADFSRVIELEPRNAQAFNDRGTEFVLAGDIAAGEADFKKAFALLPDFAEPYNNLGKSYEIERKFDQAIDNYTKAYQLFREQDAETSKLYSALMGRGAAYQGVRNFELAFEDYDQAIALEPNLATAYNDRGLAYYALKAFGRSIEDFDKAIQLGDTERAPLNRALALKEDGKGELALKAYDQVLASKPDNANALTGRCLTKLLPPEHVDSALADCEKAVSLLPSDAEALLALGAVYVRLNRLDEARDLANLVLSKQPRFGRALFLRGVARVRKGDASGGQADIASAVAINRNIPAAAKRYGLAP